MNPENELPGWIVINPGGSGVRWRALEPSFRQSGIAIEADDPVELVERCRSWVRIVELAAGRAAGKNAPQRPANGQVIALPVDPPNGHTNGHAPARSIASLSTELGTVVHVATTNAAAKDAGFTGNSCGTCGSLRMRGTGRCEFCADCGTQAGCS